MTDKVVHFNRPDGTRPALREVMANSPTEFPQCPLTELLIWDKEAVMARISAALYRHAGPSNTAGVLTRALGRESVAGVKAWLERRNTPSAAALVQLHYTEGFGEPFTRAWLGLPENPDLTRAIALLQQLESELLKEGR